MRVPAFATPTSKPTWWNRERGEHTRRPVPHPTAAPALAAHPVPVPTVDAVPGPTLSSVAANAPLGASDDAIANGAAAYPVPAPTAEAEGSGFVVYPVPAPTAEAEGSSGDGDDAGAPPVSSGDDNDTAAPPGSSDDDTAAPPVSSDDDTAAPPGSSDDDPGGAGAGGSSSSSPHIVFMYIDDMGWADVGWNNDEAAFATGTIDQLAKDGVRLHW